MCMHVSLCMFVCMRTGTSEWHWVWFLAHGLAVSLSGNRYDDQTGRTQPGLSTNNIIDKFACNNTDGRLRKRKADIKLSQTLTKKCWNCITRKLSYHKDGAIYMGALKIFGSPWVRPRLLIRKFLIGFCSDRSSECAYRIWSSYLYLFLR